MFKPAAIANKFLEFARDEGRLLTNMHLQKLALIAHGWNLALFKKPLIGGEAKVWKFGPVYPELYNALSKYGSGSVTDLVRQNDDNVDYDVPRGPVVRAQFSQQQEKLLKAVWDSFKTFSGLELSAMTHMDNSPWSIAKKQYGLNSSIPDDLSRSYYEDLLKAESAGEK